ncbi:alpha-amylase family glycosyl hydrolase [Bacillus dakarensis]|uniref:alpha-amylase family glycosyl hydrolase n=1 Tax=Robertmurraya dakarensis TaxID=1926278 RepID=UPI000981B001|nr:alpha-amylase family glycosyl hydrolase [Bacillus dakarensis]
MKKLLFFITVLILFFSSLPASAAGIEERTWQDETIYYLMVDRFNNNDVNNDYTVDILDPDRYHGGDFQGIIDQLDYLKDMGFTAIALNPIFDNEDNGYHGYWIKDFYEIEEHYGTIDTFKALISEAHERDMKVMVDFVVHTVGPNHPWAADPEKDDWLADSVNEDDTLTLNLQNNEVKDYIIEAAKWWIEETNLDGYRLKAVDEAPADFWTSFAAEVKKVKENFYLLGDLTSDDPQMVEKYKGTGIDGFYDYELNKHARSVFATADQALEPLFKSWEQRQAAFENPYLAGTFMDNHNMTRFTRESITKNEHPGPRWKLALTYLYTVPGIPIVYYGSEIALDGGGGTDNFGQMDFRTDKELIDHITSIGELRNSHPALTRGTFELLHEDQGMAVYKREFEDETVVVALNNSTFSQSVTITSELEDNMELRGLLNGDLVRSAEGQYQIILDRDEAEIYLLAEKTGVNIPLIAATSSVAVGFVIFLILLKIRSRRTAP